MKRVADATAWILSGTLFLVVVVATNLTGLGIGRLQLTFDDVALPRLAVALIGITAAWALLAYMLARGNTLSWDWTWVTLGALGLWAVVSAAASGTVLAWLGQSERLEGAVTVLLYAAAFGAGLQVGRSSRYLRRMAVAFVAGSVVLAAFGLLQAAKLDPTNYLVSGYSFYLGSAFASLGNPNFLGGVLVLALPIAAALGLTAASRVGRIAGYVAAVIGLLALYYTYSQGAWVAAVVQLALAVVFLMRRRAMSSGRPADAAAPAAGEEEDGPDEVAAAGEGGTADTTAAVGGSGRPVVIATAIVVVGVVVIIVASAIAYRMGLSLWGSSLSETTNGRVLLAETVGGAVAARPLTGYGPDAFLTAFRLHRPDRFMQIFGVRSTANNAHSWPLQYVATLGVPGALLLCAALVLAFVRGRPRRGAAGGDGAVVLSAAVWLGCLGYVIQMMFNVAVIASTVPFWALLAAVAAPHARRLTVPRVPAWVLTGACTLLAACAIAGSALLLRSDVYYLSSRLADNGLAPGDPVALAQDATRLDPLSLKYARSVAQARMGVVLNATSDPASSKEQVRLLYDDAKTAFDRSLALSGGADYPSLAWLAGVQMATGRHLGDAGLKAEALRTAREAAAQDRTHSEVASILKGDTSDKAIGEAISAPSLP